MLEVSHGGFYDWALRSPSVRSVEDARLTGRIRQSFLESDRTYGVRRVARDLLDWGERCGTRRTARLMRLAALRARPKRSRPPSDAAVLDLFSRRVVGRSMSSQMTAQLVIDALLMAVWRRGKPRELLHHSDQGSQYTSEDFQRLLADQGIACSMSRRGDCWDKSSEQAGTIFTARLPRDG